MDVVLDTNIYRQDLSAKSSKFDVLLDYVEKTNSRILLPTLVRAELAGHLTREISERQARIAAASSDISRLLPHRSIDPLPLGLDIVKEVGDYLAYLQTRLGVGPQRLLEHKDSYLRDVISRAIARRRPCSDAGQEFRDAVLWLTVLDAAATCSNRTIAFISNNKKQFADAADKLHPDLLADCRANAVSVSYFVTLEDFVRQHGGKVAFATAEWLASQVDIGEVIAEANDGILRIAERTVERELRAGDQIVDLGEVDGDLGDVAIYVYEMADGSFRIDAIYAGNFEVVVDVEEEEPHGPEGAYSGISRRKVRVECNIAIDAEVSDEKVVAWSLNSVDRA